MQWEGKSACVQVRASNEEFQKMFAERERNGECRQKIHARIMLGSVPHCKWGFNCFSCMCGRQNSTVI